LCDKAKNTTAQQLDVVIGNLTGSNSKIVQDFVTLNYTGFETSYDVFEKQLEQL